MRTTHLLGGVSSGARVMPKLDGEDLVAARSSGPWIWDQTGRRYADTALGYGGTVLGHAPPAVVDAATEALRSGPLPAFVHPREEQAAAAIAAHTGPLSQIVFNNTGSEAVHLACRAARLVTGRPRIAKLAAGFDGWLDDVVFGTAGTAEASFSDGARPETDRFTLLRPNDIADAERLFAQRDDIAAVLFEPLLANAGCLMLELEYLMALQDIARRNGALVIVDEVLMGFRLHAGLASQLWGLDPDLAAVGKAIGSGIGVAAVAGRPEIMQVFTDGRGIRAGTFSGNPVASAAVIATLELLDQADYPALLAKGERLRALIASAFAQTGQAVSTSGYGTVFTIWPSAEPPRNYAESRERIRPEWSRALHLEMRRAGALIMPSGYGRLYLSFAHDDEAMVQLAGGFVRAAATMKAGG
ncbi:aminotransferase class III-fold pyridoxal phosphate-dependent enzyme [Sphingomonas oligophenolica]|uniref:Aminotransferase class III-fold pyridoxal phosphate-dependent enzyme n=1 Tax=Sphingomonas oligophenolica TaxID=301154 RepID=A0ABU9Y6D6_9SPHN